MTDDIFLDHIDAHGSVMDESVGYAKPGEYPFTSQEFHTWTEGIWNEAGGWDKSEEFAVDGAMFETYYVPFERRGKKYWLNIMYGQGSCWTVMTDAEHGEYKKRIAELDGVSEEEVKHNKDVWLAADKEIKKKKQ